MSTITLEHFLTELSTVAQGIDARLIVIRNFEKLPKENIGNDIDLIINEADVSRWLDILSQVCSVNQLKLEVTKQFYYCTKLEISGNNFNLELDLNNRFEWKGIKFHDVGSLIENAFPYNDIIFTSDSFSNAYITFHHSFLYGGFINYKYIAQNKLLLSNRELFESKIKTLGGMFTSRIIIKKLINNEKFSRTGANFLRSYIWLYQFSKSPIRVLFGLYQSIYYDLFR